MFAPVTDTPGSYREMLYFGDGECAGVKTPHPAIPIKKRRRQEKLVQKEIYYENESWL